MLSKLIRQEYYDDEYPLNEQEFKEFNFVRFDPYWKIRSTCFKLNLSCFGDKELMTKRIELLLFDNFLHKRPSSSEIKDLARTDIEIVTKNIPHTSKKFDKISLRDLEGYVNSEMLDKSLSKREFDHQWPWQVVPELSKKQQELSYSDVYKGMTHFMRPTMIFYNHFQDNEPYITAIVALPYTPKMLDQFTAGQLYLIAKTLDMQFTYDTPNVVDVVKQKLLDLFYCVEDSKQMHGIVPCQSSFRSCERLASTFCANHMCKECCQDTQHRDPCIIHDRHDQFYRNKIKSLFLFEQTRDFDNRRTLRLFCRKLIRKNDLEKAFEDCDIDWSELAVYHHPTSCRIQCIYLVFNSPQDATRVYEERDFYTEKLEKYDVKISALSTNLYKIAEAKPNANNTLAIIRPFTTLEAAESLPTGNEYIKSLIHLVHGVTQLDSQNFIIEEDRNPLTDEPDYQQVFVTLPSRQYVDRLYEAQPYFGCLVAHKLSHIQICSYQRYRADQCLMCSSKKSPSCIHDMCQDCCARQKFGTSVCKGSADVVQSLLADRKEKANLLPSDWKERGHDGSMKSDALCEKCQNERDPSCSNGVCAVCCPIQAIRSKCKHHDESFYSRNLRSANNSLLPKKLLQMVAEMHIKVRHELKNGRYDWFRPLYGTSIQNEMVKANRELQMMIDNGSILRGSNQTKHSKEGRILTFQANLPITIQLSAQEKIYESVDKKGSPFVEYDYNDGGNSNQDRIEWVKNNPNKYRTFSKEDHELHTNAPNRLIASNFHLLLIGLDTLTYTVREMYSEIQSKLRSSVGQIDQKNIMILDRESFLPNIFSGAGVFMNCRNLESNLNRLGRVACVKFNNPIDAIAALVRAVKITLPLNDGTIGEPIIYPSSWLLKFIENFDLSSQEIEFKNLGACFTKELREFDQCYIQLKEAEKPSRAKKGGKKKGGKGKKKVKKAAPNPFKKIKK